MSWLRRRGPPLPEAARQRLFRQETVRLYDPATQRVGRVKKDRLLPPGAMLLLPKAAVAEAAAAEQASSASQRAAAAAERRSPAQQQAQQAAVAELRSALLRNERDFIAVNKPAGLATQGGRNVAVSVDNLMGDALGGLPGVSRPTDLRLVHRLDRQTTGVLLVAKSPDAAAWLSAAFRDDGSSSCAIRKTYWATGRKHQLRRHCAALGAPILGDGRYGALRSPGQAAVLADLQQHSDGGGGGSGSGPPLLLHSRPLELLRQRGGKGDAALKIEAPLPESWQALLQRQGWPLPRDERR
ncbi:hypothetical protein COHA_004641 [Chlorella ohadii]|uniref:Pseudouridine synthase RsuA/RluA-like domain-containing protein n=1 Tax=Chlorella ohadii TaxID=2649997 RepID=A0AAD5H2T1_9CHLO|nr:hypothetical protein COHA_004641 [Chlorella ohadii]